MELLVAIGAVVWTVFMLFASVGSSWFESGRW